MNTMLGRVAAASGDPGQVARRRRRIEEVRMGIILWLVVKWTSDPQGALLYSG
jgi:hypothetical protein